MINPEGAAKLFIKEVKGNIDFDSVEEYLIRKGYKIIFFNTETGDKEIIRYNLTYKAKNTKAFTYIQTANIIFIDNDISAEDKTYLLYHELGHILLGHLNCGRMSTQNKILKDVEADAFVFALLHPHKTNKAIPLLFILLMLCSFGLGTIYDMPKEYTTVNSTSGTSSIPSPEPITNFVCVTSTGKYHRENCIHVKDKHCLKVDISEAAKVYQACKVCNP